MVGQNSDAATDGSSGSTSGEGTTATGTPTGGGTSSSTNGSSDGGSCEKHILAATRATPDMLVVLDRSGSMSDDDNETDRWAGSVDAINTVVGELEDEVRFGLMTFPGTGSASGGNQSGGQSNPWDDDDDDDDDDCAPGVLDVPIGPMNAEPIATTLGGMDADGRTPTAQTLQEARRVLSELETEAAGSAEFAAPNQYVLLVTDGDPNCMGDRGDDDDDEGAARQATIEEVSNLASDGVQTYVIGFQTAGSDFADVLDMAAVAGGTGDTMHRSVDSGESLLEEFRRIAGSAVSCSFVLAQDVDEARVRVLVDGSPAEYGTHWDLRDDQRTVDLLGATCDALQAGARVEAEVLCETINII